MKKLNKDADTKLLHQTQWLVEQTVHYQELTICPRAQLLAPAGKYISLIVDGVGRDLVPGTYRGNMVLAVSDLTQMPPHALMRQNDISCDLQTALVVDDGGAHVITPELIAAGTVTDTAAENLYLGTTAPSYNGIGGPPFPRLRGLLHWRERGDHPGFRCLANTPKGAAASAATFSILQTAISNNLDPYRYLMHIFREAPKLAARNEDWVTVRYRRLFRLSAEP